MVINLKKDKNVRTPPVIKEPRPLLTMGDVWNVSFVAVAFLLQKASGAILNVMASLQTFHRKLQKALR